MSNFRNFSNFRGIQLNQVSRSSAKIVEKKTAKAQDKTDVGRDTVNPDSLAKEQDLISNYNKALQIIKDNGSHVEEDSVVPQEPVDGARTDNRGGHNGPNFDTDRDCDPDKYDPTLPEDPEEPEHTGEPEATTDDVDEMKPKPYQPGFLDPEDTTKADGGHGERIDDDSKEIADGAEKSADQGEEVNDDESTILTADPDMPGCIMPPPPPSVPPIYPPEEGGVDDSADDVDEVGGGEKTNEPTTITTTVKLTEDDISVGGYNFDVAGFKSQNYLLANSMQKMNHHGEMVINGYDAGKLNNLAADYLLNRKDDVKAQVLEMLSKLGIDREDAEAKFEQIFAEICEKVRAGNTDVLIIGAETNGFNLSSKKLGSVFNQMLHDALLNTEFTKTTTKSASEPSKGGIGNVGGGEKTNEPTTIQLNFSDLGINADPFLVASQQPGKKDVDGWPTVKIYIPDANAARNRAGNIIEQFKNILKTAVMEQLKNAGVDLTDTERVFEQIYTQAKSTAITTKYTDSRAITNNGSEYSIDTKKLFDIFMNTFMELFNDIQWTKA